MMCIFSDIDTLLLIEERISERLGTRYLSSDYIRENGYMHIHESYEAQIMQVLQGFTGRYEIKRAVFGEPDEDGNVEITWQKIK